MSAFAAMFTALIWQVIVLQLGALITLVSDGLLGFITVCIGEAILVVSYIVWCTKEEIWE